MYFLRFAVTTALTLSIVRGLDIKVPANPEPSDDWVPVGMKFTNLDMMYRTDVTDNLMEDGSNLETLHHCSNGMHLVASLPRYLSDVFVKEMTESKTLDSLVDVPDELELPEDDKAELVLTNEQLDSAVAELFDDEADSQLKTDLEENLKDVLDDQTKAKVYDASRLLRAYSILKCNHFCNGHFCFLADVRYAGKNTYLRRCSANCHRQQSSNICHRRPSRYYRDDTYCCAHRFAPRLYARKNLRGLFRNRLDGVNRCYCQ